MRVCEASDGRRTPGCRGLRALVQYALLGAFMVAMLLPGIRAELSVYCDTTRDLLLAQACQSDEVCAMRGADTTVPGLAFSSLWGVHLAVLGDLGLDVESIYRLSLAMLVAGLFLVVFMAESIAGRTVGFAVGALGILAHTKMVYWLHLWNPTAVLLPSAVYFCAITAAVYSRHWAAYAATGFALAMTTAIHPVAIILVLSLPWMLILHPPRRLLLGVFSAVVGLLVPFFAFSRDALVVLVREWSTGGLADGLGKESQAVPGLLTICAVGSALVALFGLLWFWRRRESLMGRVLRSRTAALLAACLAPAAVSLFVLLAANRLQTDRYLAFLLPGMLLAVAVGARAVRARWPGVFAMGGGVARWLGPLVPLVVAALLSGYVLVRSTGRPQTWSYQDGAAAAAYLGSQGVDDFGAAVAVASAPGIRSFFTAIRPFLARDRDSSKAQYVGPNLLFAVVGGDLDGVPDEWRVRNRPDGTLLVGMPIAGIFDTQTGEVSLSNRPEADSKAFVPVLPSGLLGTSQSWLESNGGPLPGAGDRLLMNIELMAVTGRYRLHALSDCHCPDATARVSHVEGARVTYEESGDALVELTGRSGVKVTGEWSYPAPCRPLDGESAAPVIVAWPSGETSFSAVLEGPGCP